jgi:glycosyltransferase involved in cell wall biosynthesis
MSVTLVIPGRDCAATLGACLEAVAAIAERPNGALAEVLLVDDGSRDETPTIAERHGVTVIAGKGAGPGAARNLGWRAAKSDLVWFIDADCVAEPDALDLLLPHLDEADVAGVGGSYGIMNDHALLARLVHEEIIARHLAMGPEVDFLATFNVLYRRSVLEALDGFDERYITAEDADLAFRALEAGHRLRFEAASRVRHFHPERLGPYLRTQRRHGFWRAFLHTRHAGHSRGNSYSSLADHLQPPVAMLALVTLPLLAAVAVPGPDAVALLALVPAAMLLGLALLQVPMTARLLRRTRRAEMLLFAPLGFLRAFWRGVGLTGGLLALLFRRR